MATGKTKNNTDIKRVEARYFKKNSFIKRSSSFRGKDKSSRSKRSQNWELIKEYQNQNNQL